MSTDQGIFKTRPRGLGSVVAAAVLGACLPVAAAPLTISVETFTGTSSGEPVVITPLGQPANDGSFDYVGQHFDPYWALEWSFNADPDPHIVTLDGLGYDFQAVGEYLHVVRDRMFTFTNARPVPTSYMLTVDVPGGSSAPTHIISGGIAATVDEGELSRHANGHPLYSMMGDDETLLELIDRDFRLLSREFAVEQTPATASNKNLRAGMSMWLSFSLSPGATASFVVEFNAEPVLPGDGNGDGWVDGLDYLLWAGNFGAHPGPDGDMSDGDYNDDGWVDGLDYLLWAGSFGSHATSEVPEPTTLLLVVTGAMSVLPMRRRKLLAFVRLNQPAG